MSNAWVICDYCGHQEEKWVNEHYKYVFKCSKCKDENIRVIQKIDTYKPKEKK